MNNSYNLLEIPPELVTPCVNGQPIILGWSDEQRFKREASFVISAVTTRGDITEVTGKAMVKWAGEKEVVVTLHDGKGRIKVKM